MLDSKQQRLVLSIIEFLNQSIQDGTVKADDRESLEVAVQCIGEAFSIDPSDTEQVERLSVKPATLQTIFDVFLKTRAKVGSAPTSSESTSGSSAPSADDKAKAEKFKQAGNTLMTSKKYDQAIESYTHAIALDATNPVYFSNRAAAHASKNDHLSAVDDSKKALQVDPSFVKAYSRLGHAQYSLGDFKAAAAVFKKGLDLDPSNVNLKTGLTNATARIEPEVDDGPPDLIPDDSHPGTAPPGAGADPGTDMFNNLGGGGMPDLANMLNNPMMMRMAEQVMANGGMESLMSNPSFANLMNRFQSGGGMPSMNEVMSDPTLRNLANQFGAGGTGK